MAANEASGRNMRLKKDPGHAEHETYMEWSGGYDTEGFDADAVSRELTKYRHWSRDRYLNWRRAE